jgi:hypothetical protein
MTGGSGEAVPTRRRRFEGGAGRAAGVNVNGVSAGLRLRRVPRVRLTRGVVEASQSCSAVGPADRLEGAARATCSWTGSSQVRRPRAQTNSKRRGGKRVRWFVAWRPVKHARVRRSGSVFSFAFFFFVTS